MSLLEFLSECYKMEPVLTVVISVVVVAVPFLWIGTAYYGLRKFKVLT